MKQSITTFIIIVTMLFLPVTNAFAASLDDIFKEFKDYENVEYVKIPRFVMWLAKFSEDSETAKKINGMTVLTISKTGRPVKEKFNSRFKQLSAGLDVMLSAREEGENVVILSKVDGDKFKNLYIYAADNDEIVLVKFSGTFTSDDIMSLSEDEKNKRKH